MLNTLNQILSISILSAIIGFIIICGIVFVRGIKKKPVPLTKREEDFIDFMYKARQDEMKYKGDHIYLGQIFDYSEYMTTDRAMAVYEAKSKLNALKNYSEN